MKFYLKLEKFCKSIFDRLSDTPAKFEDSSTVTRFIKDKKHKKILNGVMTATPDAFIYPEGEHSISLAHIDNITERHIWKIGDKRVFAKTGKPAICRADMNVGELRRIPLPNFSIIRDNAEFWRHVTASCSSDKRLWANQLSILSTLVLRK